MKGGSRSDGIIRGGGEGGGGGKGGQVNNSPQFSPVKSSIHTHE